MKSFRHVVGTKPASRRAQLFGPRLKRSRTVFRHLARYCAVAILLGLPVFASATEFYVSPTGSASGTGSQASPWDLQTALNQPSAVRPGDTIWLTGGTYRGWFTANLNGTATAPIIVRAKPGQRAIIDGNLGTASIYKNIFTVQGNYTWIWGLEIINSWVSTPARTTSQAGSWPTDYPNGAGLVTANSGTGTKFINCLVHDCPVGICVWNGAVDTEMYGCLSWYNGWMGSDRPHGHGSYAQNALPSHKYIRENYFFDNADHGIQIYGTTSADGFEMSGCAIWNNADLFGVKSGRNLLVGTYGQTSTDQIIVSNMVYRKESAFGDRSSDVYFGYGSGEINSRIQDNYFVGPNQWGGPYTGDTISGNTAYGPATLSPASQFPNNTFTTTRPTGVKVFVRPNKYELGRANIVIYNWNLASTVSVNISGIGLAVGDQYELHNAMNYFGDVITGTYSGGTISVPMTGRTVAAPLGLPAPASPFPEFGAFVIVKSSGAATGNTPPTISAIANHTVNANASTGPLPLTVGDAQTAAASLTLSASSANPVLVPAANIVLGGSGASRTVTVTPAANQAGNATITLTVSDGSLTTSTSFGLTVNPVSTANTPPTISSIGSQTIKANTSAGPLSFTVGDAQTAASGLTVSTGSSNASLVPNGAIVLGGSGASRTVTVTPAANQSGNATITVTVSDGSLTTSTSFGLTVNAVGTGNTPPTISAIADQTIALDTVMGPLAFTIGDAETPAANLTVSATRGSSGLVAASAILFGGSGATRTVAIAPLAGQYGSVRITINVSDGVATASESFLLTISALPVPVNTPPTISAIANRSIAANTSTGPVSFSIGDAQTAAGSLTLSASSSNGVLVPAGGLALGGSGASRTVTVTPATGQSGSATITITVSDGALTASSSFGLTVNPVTPVNTPPTISAIANQIVTEDSAVGPLAFTVGDTQTAAGSLTVSTSSSNQALVPNNRIVLGGSGANRTVTVTPAAGQSGTASILLSVSDGSATTASSFALTVTPAGPANPLVYLPVEAESGTLVAPMQVTADPGASGGAYLSSALGGQGSVSFAITIPVADTYVIWCRILASDATSDSFLVSVDGGTPDIYDAAEGTWSPDPQWTVVNGHAGGAALTLNPRTFVLSPGAHTITFQGREANTVLDRLIITNDRGIAFGEMP